MTRLEVFQDFLLMDKEIKNAMRLDAFKIKGGKIVRFKDEQDLLFSVEAVVREYHIPVKVRCLDENLNEATIELDFSKTNLNHNYLIYGISYYEYKGSICIILPTRFNISRLIEQNAPGTLITIPYYDGVNLDYYHQSFVKPLKEENKNRYLTAASEIRNGYIGNKNIVIDGMEFKDSDALELRMLIAEYLYKRGANLNEQGE